MHVLDFWPLFLPKTEGIQKNNYTMWIRYDELQQNLTIMQPPPWIQNRVFWVPLKTRVPLLWCHMASSWRKPLCWILAYHSLAFLCSLVHMYTTSICSLLLSVLSQYKWNCYLDSFAIWFFSLDIIFWDTSDLMCVAIFYSFPMLYNSYIIVLHYF